PALDLTDPRTVAAALAAQRGHVIVNAAAYTDTERAEVESDIAEAVNSVGAGAVATCARGLGVPIIHISTGDVSDGSNPDPYRETDPVSPLNAYGRSKLGGERAVVQSGARHVILRTSLVYSPFGRNFVRNLLKLAEQRPEIRVVADQIGNPTAAADMADAILTLARNLVQSPDRAEGYGIFHLTAQGAVNWAEFAKMIFALAGGRRRPRARIIPIPSTEYQSMVRRPPNSRLDCGKIASAHGIVLPHWETSLRNCMDSILGMPDTGGGARPGR